MEHRIDIKAFFIAGLMASACTNNLSTPSEDPKGEEVIRDKPAKVNSPPPVLGPFQDATEEAFRTTGLPSTIAGREIFAYLKTAHETPTGSVRQDLTKITGALKSHAAEVLATLRDTYARLPETSFSTRWSLVFVMGELRDVIAVPALEEIAGSEVPPERFERQGHWEGGSQQEELRIRATATGGIATLAREGKVEAIRSLRSLMRPDVSALVRGTAVRAYLETGDRTMRRDELIRVLDPAEHWMLDHPTIPLNRRPLIADPAQTHAVPFGPGGTPATH
jgi:hypothetical protein